MNPQESLQLLEEMGLPESYKCPSCNEIIIKKLKRFMSRDGIVNCFICSNCTFYFSIVKCKICGDQKYNHKANICYDCFTKSGTEQLQLIKDANKQFQKLLIITSRGKPDLAFSISGNLYNKINQLAKRLDISRKEFIVSSIQHKISRSRMRDVQENFDAPARAALRRPAAQAKVLS